MPSPDPVDVAKLYDVGAITRAIQSQFRLFCPQNVAAKRCLEGQNLATPAAIGVLLDELDAVTDAVVARVSEETMNPLMTPQAKFAFNFSMAQWRTRLQLYRNYVDAAAPDDRAAILWDVTAPLLIGYYGGEHSDEPQRVIDAVTPFILANMQAVDEAFRDELWSAFVQDVQDNLKELAIDVVKPIAQGFGFGALIVGGAILAIALRR